MSRTAPSIALTPEDKTTLQKWIRSTTTEQRLAFRAKIVLRAAGGMANKDIAKELQTREATVGYWRNRFSSMGIPGLQDAPRPGARPKYGSSTEQRILAKLDDPPPEGYAQWNGRLVAEALGGVSSAQVWRVLRRHGIQLQRRRSWCVSTDPEFASKAADIVGLYLNPPENAIVLCVDEKPSIQALERAQGYLRFPDGRALRGFSHDYTRHGTTTLFAALETATGRVSVKHYNRRRRREFLDFMNETVAHYPGKTLHVIVDNLNTHKPKKDQWLRRHKNVRFHYTPTHGSWMNQIECWFSVLSRAALRGASFTSPAQLRQAINRFVAVYNKNANPFEWRKEIVYPKPLRNNYTK